MKVLPQPAKLIESIEFDIRINFISSLFKIIMILAIAFLVFLLTSRSNFTVGFDDNQDTPATSWQSPPPAPY